MRSRLAIEPNHALQRVLHHCGRFDIDAPHRGVIPLCSHRLPNKPLPKVPLSHAITTPRRNWCRHGHLRNYPRDFTKATKVGAPMRREFEHFWNRGCANSPGFPGLPRKEVTMKVIFGTRNRVSRGCSKNPKIQNCGNCGSHETVSHATGEPRWKTPRGQNARKLRALARFVAWSWRGRRQN